MKKYLLLSSISLLTLLMISCGGNDEKSTGTAESAKEESESGENPSYDPHRGTGKFTKVDIPGTLDAPMAEKGNKVYGVKCSSCHKLTDEKLVGPGWKGVTQRRAAEWVMNFVTNTDEMIDKDPAAQAQLEICLVRMPNQNLTDNDARSIYEFMRQNDGVK